VLTFANGYTRHVILVGNIAIKISRTGIIVTIQQVLHGILDPAWLRSRLSEHRITTHRALFHRIVSILVGGVRANRQEHRLYTEHPELPIAPVHGLYLGGIILVMARGEPVSSRSSARLRKRYRAYGDLGEPYHVCRVRKRLCYIDYGHPLAPLAFGV
jgi:hypothetical protein